MRNYRLCCPFNLISVSVIWKYPILGLKEIIISSSYSCTVSFSDKWVQEPTVCQLLIKKDNKNAHMKQTYQNTLPVPLWLVDKPLSCFFFTAQAVVGLWSFCYIRMPLFDSYIAEHLVLQRIKPKVVTTKSKLLFQVSTSITN